jgi:hypothetical protein
MLTSEEFKEVVDNIEAGESLDNEKAKSLIQTIAEMDMHNAILLNALELSIENAQEVIPGVVEKVLSMSGRTDSKSKKKAAKYAAEITARFEVAIQLYLAGAADKAQEVLYGTNDIQLDDEEETDNATQEATNEERA